jgi:hypothetical protein
VDNGPWKTEKLQEKNHKEIVEGLFLFFFFFFSSSFLPFFFLSSSSFLLYLLLRTGHTLCLVRVAQGLLKHGRWPELRHAACITILTKTTI